MNDATNQPLNLCDPLNDPYNREQRLKARVDELDHEVARLIIVRGELMHIGVQMAQELQEFVCAGKEGGSDMAASAALLADWEQIYHCHSQS